MKNKVRLINGNYLKLPEPTYGWCSNHHVDYVYETCGVTNDPFLFFCEDCLLLLTHKIPSSINIKNCKNCKAILLNDFFYQEQPKDFKWLCLNCQNIKTIEEFEEQIIKDPEITAKKNLEEMLNNPEIKKELENPFKKKGRKK